MLDGTLPGGAVDHLARMAHQADGPSNAWGSGDDEEDAVDPLSVIAQPPPSLEDVLLQQVHAMRLTEGQMKVAEAIIGALNEHGYLEVSLEAVAQETGVPVETAAQALEAVQSCEPVGIGARSLGECLWLQLKARGEGETLEIG